MVSTGKAETGHTRLQLQGGRKSIKSAFEDTNLQIPAATAEPEDYTDEDGLLYCGKCRTPKEAYFPADKIALFGRDRHPAECDCRRATTACFYGAVSAQGKATLPGALQTPSWRKKSPPLLIIDDFGMERGTEYGLEQVYNVIDSRYRSGKPLIVTTNLSLDELNNPPDTAHKRIYDRVTEMCTPVCFSGVNFRREKAQEKMERLRKLLNVERG